MENFGKKLAVGDTFISVSKKVDKWNKKRLYLKNGFTGFFTNGKRRYYGKVICLIEFKTGFHRRTVSTDDRIKYNGIRYWQYSYLIKIIEN